MKKINTGEAIKQAALSLFAENGFAGTSIAAIETAAGLAPRAGAFYRHFASKEALFETLALELITETPEEFDFEGLRSFGDTRAELVALARQFEIASERQRPYLRLIEEVRLSESGREFEAKANNEMLEALMAWVATKSAAIELESPQLAALTLSIFGAWLFFLGKQQQGMQFQTCDRDDLLEHWAGHWAGVLDQA